ncbi:MAG: cyclic nucleotide-binding domain-containing protein, partial [Candidatus Rokuibacteriota bacterium]
MVRGISDWLGWAWDAEHARRVALLAETPVFAGLSRRLLGHLGAALFEKAYVPGDVVFHEGDPGKGLFIVLDGAVAITRSTPDGEQHLATLGPGEAFGELALIDDLPRSATARITAPSRLLILYRSHFEGLVEGNRGIALVVTRNLLRRLATYVRRAGGTLPERALEAPARGAGPEPSRGSRV